MNKNKNLQEYLVITEEVKQALAAKRPVVALESTIISHGMPYPQNLQMAKDVEQIVRDQGAIPATIAIIKGKIHIGLSEKELEYFSTAKNIAKASTRSIPHVIATETDGATTVSATIFCADLAGIRIMVTGGIGGVHREAEKTFDISSDLTELSRSRVAVICAGAKSILDIEKTLEYLETLAVPVVGYKTDEFPAFYIQSSGFPVEARFDDNKILAKFLKAKWDLRDEGGVVIGNPVPEEAAMDATLISNAIEQSLRQCQQKSISGKAVTPFLLDKIKNITEGKSLTTNIALVKHNALVGAQIAVQLAHLN